MGHLTYWHLIDVPIFEVIHCHHFIDVPMKHAKQSWLSYQHFMGCLIHYWLVLGFKPSWFAITRLSSL